MFEACVRLDDRAVLVTGSDDAARQAMDFVLRDLDVSGSAPAPIVRIGAGRPAFELADQLMMELTRALIWEYQSGLALHAALVDVGDATVLMPAASGSGKSTLTVYAGLRGHRVHTDELLFCRGETLLPLRRPAHLKPPSAFVVDALSSDPTIWRGAAGALIPIHRLGPGTRAPKDKRVIVAPRYVAGAPVTVAPLTAAERTAVLLEALLNARNFADLGIAACARLAGMPAIRVTYDVLGDALAAIERFVAGV